MRNERTVGASFRRSQKDASDISTNAMQYAHSGSRIHASVETLVLSQKFDFMSALLIIANAVSIGANTEYMSSSQSEFMPFPLRAIQVIFCIVFAIELGLRLYVFRLRFFYVRGAVWNYMDLGLVLLQVAEELVAVVLGTAGRSNDDSSVGSSAPSLLRLLRILRLVRVLRVMRVLKFAGELRALVISVLGCMRPFLWTLVLLFLVLYLFAVYFTQVVINHRVEKGELTPELEQHFGSLFVSLLVLYESMTGGLDWHQAVEPLIQDISPAVGIVFVLYIAFTSLAMTNVLTGIFVESALLRAKEDRELVIERNARDLFSKVDRDGDGMIVWDTFQGQLADLGVKEYFKCIDVNIADAQKIFSLLDENYCGIINAEEFHNGCLELRKAAKSLDLLMLSFETSQVFQAQDEHLSRIDRHLSVIADELRAPYRDMKVEH